MELPFLSQALWNFFLVVFAFILLGKVTYFFLNTVIAKVVKKTRTSLDDALIQSFSLPVQYLFFIVGIGLAGMFFYPLPGDAFKDAFISGLGLVLLAWGTWVVLKSVDFFSDNVLRPWAGRTQSQLDDQLVPLAQRSAKYTILILAFLLALSNVGYDVTALLAGLGIGGLAIAFAAQETIKDIFGGITLFANKSFFIGDRITVNGVTGRVESIFLRTTRIRDDAGRFITLPNNKVATEVIENWSRAPGRHTVTVLDLEYTTPYKKLEKAKEIVRSILDSLPGVKKKTFGDLSSLVWFSGFSSSSLKLNIVYYVDENQLVPTWDGINMAIKKEFEKEGISFAYPTQTLYVKQEK
ncbi:MAG: mechanosensitive ion channel [Candidatus Diapherotrites archaeon]|nr:mechanosensitive ion channel [Candidatus Diapherotrites archaeon]